MLRRVVAGCRARGGQRLEGLGCPSRTRIEEKVAEYLSAGVRLVWVADPATRTVRVHRTFGDPRTFGDRRTFEEPRTFGEGDILPGDEVLPGFEVEVRRLFDG